VRLHVLAAASRWDRRGHGAACFARLACAFPELEPSAKGDTMMSQEPFASEAEVETEARRQQEELGAYPIELATPRAQMQICCSSPVPSGWIKTNDSWDPTSCGNPSSIYYNICTIVEYSNLPVGSVLQVCSDAPTPANWVEVGNRWDPTSCGHPSSIYNNIKTIRRAQ